MKKQKGFTLIELIIGIAVLVIVLAGLALIFGQSSMASQTGMNQNQAYEEARVAMETIKTSIRYANKDYIYVNTDETTKPDEDTTVNYLSCQGSTVGKHWDVTNYDNDNNVNYKTTVAWTSDYKQVNIKVEDVDKNTIIKSITYPKNTANSAFKGASGISEPEDFPIQYKKVTTIGKNTTKTDVLVYDITLPVKYAFNNGTKTDVLTSHVNPTDYSSGTVNVIPETPADLDTLANNFVVALNAWESGKVSDRDTTEGWNLQSGWDAMSKTTKGVAQQKIIKQVYDYLKTYKNDYYNVANANLPNFDSSNASIWYQLTNNAPIRAYYQYLSKNHTFPSVTFTNGVTVYTKPYVLFEYDNSGFYNQLSDDSRDFSPPKSILTTGSTNTDTLANDTYIQYIYDSEYGKWYTATTPTKKTETYRGSYYYSITSENSTGTYKDADFYYTYINGAYYNVLYYTKTTEYFDKADILAWVRANWVEIKVKS